MDIQKTWKRYKMAVFITVFWILAILLMWQAGSTDQIDRSERDAELEQVIRQAVREEIREELEPYSETQELMNAWLLEWNVLTQEEWEQSEESGWESEQFE